MITRIDYEAPNWLRSATILLIHSNRWSVVLRSHERGKFPATKSAKHRFTKTLTAAQGLARTWVDSALSRTQAARQDRKEA